MIRYFDRNETNFNHNEMILNPISCYISEEVNGLFELECEVAKNVSITEGDIIKAPSPRGEQLFRIYRVKKSLKGKMAYARHIFYDLSKNFLINVDLNNASGFTAIQSVLSNCETNHNFVATSDVLSQNTVSYKRINPVQAIIGDENCILNLWGGNLIRNNFSISIKAEGTDRGYEIRLGKNLIGIDADIDESNVKTRIYPTVVLGDNDTIYALPEKYVDSSLINNYGEPIIYTVEVSLTDEQKALSIEEIYQIMRDYCNELFEIHNIDKPLINYKVNFVELSKTEQYKNLAILEKLDLYDIVTVNVSHLDINVKAKVIKYKYDCLKDRYDTIELGDFSSVSSYTTEGIVSQINNRIKANETAVEYATNVITGNKGGYVVFRRYPDGKPYEILIMDTEDINTAVNVLRMNNSGLGFSRNGYNGMFGTAMTIDGHIVADYVDTGILTSILLKSSNYVSDISGMQINLADGTILSKNFKVDSYGNIIANNATLNNGTFSGSLQAATGTFTGQITGGSMNINNKFIVDSSGNLTANNANIVNGSFSGSITSNSATITGGSFNVTASSQYDTRIRLAYGDFYSSLSPYALMLNGGTSANNTEIRPGNIIVGDITGVANTEISYGGINTPSLTVGGHSVITTGNIFSQSVSYASSAGTSSSCSTGYLTLSAGTLVAPSGSLWIGQNTVKANVIEQLSSESFKKNINVYNGTALDLICNTQIKTYNYKSEEDGTKLHLGMLVEEAPLEVVSESGESLDLGALTSMAWKAIQEQIQIIDSQDNKINALEQRLSKLEVA